MEANLFLKLTTLDDKTLTVNAASIACYQVRQIIVYYVPQYAKGTTINLVSGLAIDVKETVDELDAVLSPHCRIMQVKSNTEIWKT